MKKNGIQTSIDRNQPDYHDIVTLFKIYRSVAWRMQMKISQVKQSFQREYGTDVDSFLESIYQAGLDLNEDTAGIRNRVEAINTSNKYIKLIDESVQLLREYHPQGEKYYWILYYTYMVPHKAENVEMIIDNLEPHFTYITRINKATYYRWRDKALKAVSGILWGFEGESKLLLQEFRDTWIIEE